MMEIVREILTQLRLDGLDTTGDWMLEEVFSTLLPLQNNFCNDRLTSVIFNIGRQWECCFLEG
ncbi:MAG: hypothetical protein ACM37W_25350 [Actinomycetota bacterium]